MGCFMSVQNISIGVVLEACEAFCASKHAWFSGDIDRYWCRISELYHQSQICCANWDRLLCLKEYQHQGPDSLKKISYQYRKSHCKDKTIIKPNYLHTNIIPLLLWWHICVDSAPSKPWKQFSVLQIINFDMEVIHTGHKVLWQGTLLGTNHCLTFHECVCSWWAPVMPNNNTAIKLYCSQWYIELKRTHQIPPSEDRYKVPNVFWENHVLLGGGH